MYDDTSITTTENDTAAGALSTKTKSKVAFYNLEEPGDVPVVSWVDGSSWNDYVSRVKRFPRENNRLHAL